VFLARFENTALIARYPLPTKIVVENPKKKTQVTVLYGETEVNTPLNGDAFSLVDEVTNSTGK
jgi:hypothetical protein